MKTLKLRKIKITDGLLSGYKYFCDKNHPLAYGTNGSVLYHRHVASIMIGRWIERHEDVHHLDGNKLNNHPDNLLICSRKEHIEIHHRNKPKKFGKCPSCKKLFTKKIRRQRFCSNCKINRTKSINKNCIICNAPFHSKNKKQKYCSQNCSHQQQKRFDIDKKELEKLIWLMPMSRLSKLLGVSDKAIKKRCNKLEIKTPPYGYWSSRNTLRVQAPYPVPINSAHVKRSK